MSLVADGPLTMVSGRSGSSRAIPSGTPPTTWSAVTTHTRQSGSRDSARRPQAGEPSSTRVPVSAMAPPPRGGGAAQHRGAGLGDGPRHRGDRRGPVGQLHRWALVVDVAARRPPV